MIPASYLYKDVFHDHWGDPSNPAAVEAEDGRPRGPGHLVRARRHRPLFPKVLTSALAPVRV